MPYRLAIPQYKDSLTISVICKFNHSPIFSYLSYGTPKWT